jgi:hypothetical protein
MLMADNSSTQPCHLIAATDVSMRISAVRPMATYAMPSSSQPIRCRDCNSNSNTNSITNIVNVNGIVNRELVDGSTILHGVMSVVV